MFFRFMGFHNEYNTNENAILCSSSGAYAGFISKYDKKVWASDCFSIIPKDDSSIDNNYLYYLLKTIQDKIYKTQSGAAQPHIYSKDLQNNKIPVPSLERQKEIVEYCEYNDTLIKQLEKEIENNKKQAQQFITGIVKAQVQPEEHDDTSSVNIEPIDEVQNEIVSIEEEVIIEPKPKVKKIVKKVKKHLVIVEEDNEV